MNPSTIELNQPKNEIVLSYAPKTPERILLKKELKRRKSRTSEIPMFINGKEVRTTNKIAIHPPHEHQHTLGYYFKGNKEHVKAAIEAALSAKKNWQSLSWKKKSNIFLKAADLIAGPYRYSINAATMLGQSKNVFQAEIDAACELADFLRFNVHFANEIYRDQPISTQFEKNKLQYRPLEGFVFALTPFNFTAIAGNLPCAPAMMGNTVVWKPSHNQIYSAKVIMKVLMEAGLPPGVVNLIYVDGSIAGKVIFEHEYFAGLHFTGSSEVFEDLWKTIGSNLKKYKSYPKIVGETGGKDFVIAHPSADAQVVSTALIRGAFEYQGQKCSAASRAYLPKSLWSSIKEKMQNDLLEIKMGSVEDFSNFINAVISESSFDNIIKYIEAAKNDDTTEVIMGGKYDKSKGYFIEPTVILSKDPFYKSMCEEIFGPILTIYIYEDEKFEDILSLCDQASPYGLTGAIFSSDKQIVELSLEKLLYSAGNFYINDKPTGAVVGQQPFGGGRKSGTNDKAGSKLNLLRWISPRTIKENLNPPKKYTYDFMLKP